MSELSMSAYESDAYPYQARLHVLKPSAPIQPRETQALTKRRNAAREWMRERAIKTIDRRKS